MGLYENGDYYHNIANPDYFYLDRTDNVFYNVDEGFIKGNIQKGIYSSYKNYNPSMPQVNSDKERLMLEIQKYSFYLIDLGLYLDIHPNDKETIKSFNDVRGKYYRLVNEFNKNYYPLMFMDEGKIGNYEWSKGNFPFNWGGNKDVGV